MTMTLQMPSDAPTNKHWDTIIIGAGAAGLFAATQLKPQNSQKKNSTLLIDHAKKAGEKIRISGGGRCNFTNIYTEPSNFLGQNRHFHKSALSRFTPWDFVERLNTAGIQWHEKTLGQLFCDDKATQIVDLLLEQLKPNGAELRLNTSVMSVKKQQTGFVITTTNGDLSCQNLVIASGGKSIPKMGATGFAYDIATQFGHDIVTPRPALVPLTFAQGRFDALAGVALPVRAFNSRASFEEAMLFTHRGLSGPAILQLSSYWRDGETITIDLSAGQDLFETLRTQRQIEGKRQISTALSRIFPTRLIEFIAKEWQDRFDLTQRLGDQSDAALKTLCSAFANWELTPSGSEGYRTAEVTLGGISTDDIDSKTMMSKTTNGLYFIGECVDVTGWLGGFNFQWAWASGFACAQHINHR